MIRLDRKPQATFALSNALSHRAMRFNALGALIGRNARRQASIGLRISLSPCYLTSNIATRTTTTLLGALCCVSGCISPEDARGGRSGRPPARSNFETRSHAPSLGIRLQVPSYCVTCYILSLFCLLLGCLRHVYCTFFHSLLILSLLLLVIPQQYQVQGMPLSFTRIRR